MYINIGLSIMFILIITGLFTEPAPIIMRLTYKLQLSPPLTYYKLAYIIIKYRLVTKSIIYIDYRVTNIVIYIFNFTFYTIYAPFLAPN